MEAAVLRTCHFAAEHPGAGAERRDLTELPVRFMLVDKFEQYFIAYDPASVPLEVVAISRGSRDIAMLLQRGVG